MSVVAVAEQFDQRRARAKVRGRSFVRVFNVTFDTVGEDGYEALTAIDPSDGTRIPQPGDQHNKDEFAFVDDVDPSQMSDSDRHWLVRVSYSTITPHVQEAERPLDRTPKHTWGALSTTVPYVRDINGKLSENVADVPYDPPLTRTHSIPVLRIQFNTFGFDKDTVTSVRDTVNSDTFNVVDYTIPPGQAKLVAWEAEGRSEAGQFFFANTVVLQFRERDPGWPSGVDADPWDHVIDQYGFSQLIYEDDPEVEPLGRENIMVVAGPNTKEVVQTQEPLKLDQFGRWIDDSRWPHLDAAKKVHKPYRTMPFAGLGLPP